MGKWIHRCVEGYVVRWLGVYVDGGMDRGTEWQVGEWVGVRADGWIRRRADEEVCVCVDKWMK